MIVAEPGPTGRWQVRYTVRVLGSSPHSSHNLSLSTIVATPLPKLPGPLHLVLHLIIHKMTGEMERLGNKHVSKVMALDRVLAPPTGTIGTSTYLYTARPSFCQCRVRSMWSSFPILVYGIKTLL